MQIQIKHSPSFASATITLAPNEAMKAEAGAMISKTPSVDIQTSTQGGFMKGLKRSFGGESFFMNTFTAGPQGGEVSVAPELAGDIVTWTLAGQTVFLQSGAYLRDKRELLHSAEQPPDLLHESTIAAIRRGDHARARQCIEQDVTWIFDRLD